MIHSFPNCPTMPILRAPGKSARLPEPSHCRARATIWPDFPVNGEIHGPAQQVGRPTYSIHRPADESCSPKASYAFRRKKVFYRRLCNRTKQLFSTSRAQHAGAECRDSSPCAFRRKRAASPIPRTRTTSIPQASCPLRSASSSLPWLSPPFRFSRMRKNLRRPFR